MGMLSIRRRLLAVDCRKTGSATAAEFQLMTDCAKLPAFASFRYADLVAQELTLLRMLQ